MSVNEAQQPLLEAYDLSLHTKIILELFKQYILDKKLT